MGIAVLALSNTDTFVTPNRPRTLRSIPIIISFTDSKLGSTTYIGLRNYGKILRDYAFWRSLLAMLAYVVIAVPVIVFVAVIRLVLQFQSY